MYRLAALISPFLAACAPDAPAFDTAGAAPASAERVSLAALTPPDAPRTVSATDARYPDRVRVRWNEVGGATGYTVVRAAAPFGPTVVLGTGKLAFFDDATVEPGVYYYYAVYASNAAGDGAQSHFDRGNALGTPTIEAAFDCASRTVGLTWDDVAGASSYRVYWAEDTTVTATTADGVIATSSPEAEHPDPNPGSRYAYRAAAVDSYGDVGPLGPVTTTTVPADLAGPVDLIGSYDAYLGANVLAWDPEFGAVAYVVYWSAAPGVTESSAVLPPVTRPTIRHTTVHSGFRYYYRVASIDLCGVASELSAELEVAVP